MIPESRFLFTQSKNELLEHTSRKLAKFFLFFFFRIRSAEVCTSKVFIKGKQIAPGAARSGKKSPLLYYVYLLKMGRVPTWGPERCVFFLPLALFNYPYQSLSNRVLGVEMSLSFSPCKRSHRGLGITVHLGVGTLPTVNRDCGDVTPGALKPQMFINGHIKECIQAHAPSLTP